ncbi:hypothetical protein [Pleomorphomonas sp. JP5]|uniref:hypothetical protein n=1 Tax=Pleomorphomonas sp. JP5 TaxID=2942998 RepID=UPI002044B66C|nr:hypothetical protein [Pleomorphomonas sp. JP5]MCM5557949.1 hypothetical protein [Pleomorphomonas sp. JP5]
MTDAAEPSFPTSTSRRFVFTTTEADAIALEALLRPADRGWRSLLGYAFALPPLVIVSWLTRDAEWPVWFASFGLAGLAAWQLSRFTLKAERSRSARRHPVGTAQVDYAESQLMGTIGDARVDATVNPGTRIEVDAGHVFVVADGQPAIILPLSAFANRADMDGFARALRGLADTN